MVNGRELAEYLRPFLAYAWDNGQKTVEFPYELPTKASYTLLKYLETKVFSNWDEVIYDGFIYYPELKPLNEQINAVVISARRILEEENPGRIQSMFFRHDVELESLEWFEIENSYRERKEIVYLYQGSYISVELK